MRPLATQVLEATVRREEQLLLCCARTSLDAEGVERLAALFEEDIDWEYLIRTALTQRVLPLLYRTLQSTSPKLVPKGILDQLRSQLQRNTGRNLLLTHKLLKLLQLFEAHRLPVIPFKGPTLAASITGNLGLRQFGDLDLLVRESDYPKAQQLLETEGFSCLKQFEWESTFVDGNCAVAVDLHKRMTNQEFRCPLDFDYLSKRLKPVVIAGTKVATLSPEDTLLMLAIQITKDAGTSYLQLARVCDIDQLLHAYPDFDLTGVLRQAKELGGERMVLFSFCLANHLLGTPFPQEIAREMRGLPVIDQLVKFARRGLFDSRDPNVADRWSIDHFRWYVRECLRDKLHPYYQRYVHNALVPCSLDQQLVPLPERLTFLHYGIRPIRLLCKYGVLLVRGRLRRNASLPESPKLEAFQERFTPNGPGPKNS